MLLLLERRMAQTRANESIEPLPKCKACDLAIVGMEVPQLNALHAQRALGRQSPVIGLTNRRVKEYT
jgi:hypothetical protein